MNDRNLLEHTFHDSVRMLICVGLFVILMYAIRGYDAQIPSEQRARNTASVFIDMVHLVCGNNIRLSESIEFVLMPCIYYVDYVGNYLLCYVIYTWMVYCAMRFYFYYFFPLTYLIPECLYVFLKLGLQIWGIE